MEESKQAKKYNLRKRQNITRSDDNKNGHNISEKTTTKAKYLKKEDESSETEIISPRKPTIELLNDRQIIYTKLHEVSTICSVDDYTMWIGSPSSSLFKVKYDLMRSCTITVIKEFEYPDVDFYDFCYDFEDDRILYSDRKNSSITAISSEYEISLFKSFRPLKPTCITVSSDNYIFVGLVNKYSYDKSPSRSIIKMSKDGTVCLKINSIQEDKVIFTMPHRCIVNSVNNNLIVAAFENSKFKGMIIVFNEEGHLTSVYKDDRHDVNFSPICVTCSSGGDIICSDEKSGYISILDSQAKLLNIIKKGTSDCRIYGNSYSMAWDINGHLIIGTKSSPSSKSTGAIQLARYTRDTESKE
ncbi:unnamed protein product [Mytilus coruscus]|uniref:Uncharacterized protein n=1 Tax=Mytilus coruscus TaxID=42192 RepID=A0A6J8AUI1_MYTCO|nr:unnamed protein product [Mytilus coruscus]